MSGCHSATSCSTGAPAAVRGQGAIVRPQKQGFDRWQGKEKAALGDAWFRQEYLCEFLDLEDSLFAPDVLQHADRHKGIVFAAFLGRLLLRNTVVQRFK